jgi:hypothetical protein
VSQKSSKKMGEIRDIVTNYYTGEKWFLVDRKGDGQFTYVPESDYKKLKEEELVSIDPIS